MKLLKLTFFAMLCGFLSFSAVAATINPSPIFKHWVPYGNEKIDTLSQYGNIWNALAMNAGGVSYEAYASEASDNPLADSLPVIMTLQNGSWVPAGELSGALYSQWQSLAISHTDPDDTNPRAAMPYLAYSTPTKSMPFPCPLVVDHFDGKNWNPVGATTLPTQTNGNALKVNNKGTPYLFYETPSDTFKVMAFNGTSWVQVGGNVPHQTQTETVGTDQDFFIAFDGNGAPFVSYFDESLDQLLIWKLVNNTWVQVGSALNIQLGGTTPSFSMAFSVSPAGVPYVVYAGPHYRSPHIVKLNQSTKQWENVGQFAPQYRYEFYMMSDPSITFSSTGTPYVAFSGNDPSHGTATSIFVMKLDTQNDQWTAVANTNIDPFGQSSALTLNANNNPYFSYIHSSQGLVYVTAKTLSK